MEFAVNYSPALADLVRAGQIHIDRFKCPAWPDLLAQARELLPVYIHFPLTIGRGIGCPLNDEKKAPVDLEWLADMLDDYGTPYINTHMIAPGENYPGIAADSRSSGDIRRVLDGALCDLEPLIHRFGAGRVLVENVINEWGWLDLCVLPDVLAQLLDETGCGFLFDLSHARLAAENLGVEPRGYINAMPLERMNEMHVTGTQLLVGDLLELVRSVGDPYNMITSMEGRKIDHLSMQGEDWPAFEWALENIASGDWRKPWVASFEYGGVGAFWEQLTDPAVYLDQLPRMINLIQRTNV